MKPEGEIQTWGDCALVIVSRDRSPSWITVQSVESILVGCVYPEDETTVWPVVALPLPQRSTLPADFEGLETHGFDCSSLCRKLHVTKGDKPASVDLNSAVATLEYEPKAKIVTSNKSVNVLSYKGFYITLPGVDRLPAKDIRSVGAHDKYIQVTTSSHEFLFRRNKPLHHSHALTFSSEQLNKGVRLGDTHVTSCKTAKDYWFADFDTKNQFRYGGPTNCRPVAIYKGIIWWQTHGGGHLIATVPDLARPGHVTYRHSWIMYIPKAGVASLSQIGSSRFVTGKTKTSTLLYDLESRSISALYSLSQNSDDKLLPGFVGDRFCVRPLDSECKKYWSELAFEKLKGKEDETQGCFSDGEDDEVQDGYNDEEEGDEDACDEDFEEGEEDEPEEELDGE